MNELDELVDQWPRNRQRTVALLAVRQAFFDNGAVHWEVGMVADEDQENVHGLMLNERQWVQRSDPAKAARHARNFALAEAALVESQRRKQGPPTGKGPHQDPRVPQQAKSLVFVPAQPRPNNRPAARPRYTAAQLQRNPLAYQASLNELDELLEHWPYKRNRILYLLATHDALVQRGGRVTDESQLLDPRNPAHHANRAQRLQRAAARAADPARADRHHQAEREARSWLECRKLYGAVQSN
ncbi:hypothetical protein MON38_20875 [Hymenobacter sp. DH14]|uniref:Uncharacterized protein n=1 Tax=Hymenobacter cyanobacteriorum TaxID=2926463 RepID=A0A9X1VIN3_9BACT|nr:hypothetical protein [Hymenobacter cyanobacteriorum]MCI1189884.1 hypothetical protein [Hymenobacter cyanobacteriorum]